VKKAMLDFQISRLALAFENSFGQEHRMRPIALRATTILGEQLSARYYEEGRLPRSMHVDAIRAPALTFDLDRTSDEQAARRIAGAWFEALTPHLKV
jgi:hypothetical protein